MKSPTGSAEDRVFEKYTCSSPGPVSTSPGLPHNVLLDRDDHNVRVGCYGKAERIKTAFEQSCKTRVYDVARRWIHSADESRKKTANALSESLRSMLRTQGRR